MRALEKRNTAAMYIIFSSTDVPVLTGYSETPSRIAIKNPHFVPAPHTHTHARTQCVK